LTASPGGTRLRAGSTGSRPQPPRTLLVVLLILLLPIVLTGCAQRARPRPVQAAPATAPAPSPPAAAPAAGGEAPVSTLPLKSYVRVPPSPPVRLEIPRIGVRTGLVQLGLQPDGAMEVPEGSDYDRAGWFTEGPEPGQLGPAVIAGHVDSKTGPSVFFRLRELRPGDQVTVRRADNRVLRFRVEAVRQYPKSELPTDDVFGPLPWPALRLITCGGTFDRRAGSYRDNLIVSTRLEGA
jgi:hypothetical protein